VLHLPVEDAVAFFGAGEARTPAAKRPPAIFEAMTN
jgi:hypothetical protein